MIAKTLIILVSVLLAWCAEFLTHNLLGAKLTPQFLILLVIFFNLYWGIRYSLAAAVMAGFVKDSFSLHPFGIFWLSLVICAFLTTFFVERFYRRGSRSHRLILSSAICLIFFILATLLHAVMDPVSWRPLWIRVFLPQLILTALVANPYMEFQKSCVSKFSV